VLQVQQNPDSTHNVFCYCRIILTTSNKYTQHVFTVFSKCMQVGPERSYLHTEACRATDSKPCRLHSNN